MQHRVFSSCQTADPTPARHVLLWAPDSPTPPPSPDMLVISPMNISSLLHPLRHPLSLTHQPGKATWWFC